MHARQPSKLGPRSAFRVRDTMGTVPVSLAPHTEKSLGYAALVGCRTIVPLTLTLLPRGEGTASRGACFAHITEPKLRRGYALSTRRRCPSSKLTIRRLA